VHAISPLFRRTYPQQGQAVFYCGPVNFQIDPQSCFADPGVILALLDDMGAMSGVAPLGTRENEIARARVGEDLLVLRDNALDVNPVFADSEVPATNSVAIK
jgi:hypothetical protein